jgi:hypothetical protein
MLKARGFAPRFQHINPATKWSAFIETHKQSMDVQNRTEPAPAISVAYADAMRPALSTVVSCDWVTWNAPLV